MDTSAGSPAVIVFAHWKGGVGKSTLSTQVASALGGVLIDLEPWGAATTWWAGSHATALWQSPDGSPILRAIATGKAPRPRRGEAGRPWLVPSHEELLALGHGESNSATATSAWAWTAEGQPALMVPTSRGPRQLAHILADSLREWAEEWRTAVVVDTAAGFSPLGDGAIAAADVLVVPVTPDQWAVPALVKFMAAYKDKIRAGLVVPNRVRSNRLSDERWSDHLEGEGVLRPPFVLGPPVVDSELLHTAFRPLRSGPVPGAAREDVIRQIELVAEAAMQLVSRTRGPRYAVG
jgi:cellulose biosynthesis protein BcsQ